MRRSRASRSSDPLDVTIQGHVTTARRAVGRAVDACTRARREGPRHLTRRTYADLMGLLSALENVRSTVPATVEDADMFPESLRDRVAEIESHIRRANRALRAAHESMGRAESAFNEAGMAFVSEEVGALDSAHDELTRIGMALESYRGVRSRRVEDEPIRRERRERAPAPAPEPLAPPIE